MQVQYQYSGTRRRSDLSSFVTVFRGPTTQGTSSLGLGWAFGSDLFCLETPNVGVGNMAAFVSHGPLGDVRGTLRLRSPQHDKEVDRFPNWDDF